MRFLLVFALALGIEHAAPAADLADLSFISGRWSGDVSGTSTDEIWTGPDSGSMMGMYREMKGGQTTFYELLVIEVQNNTPTLLLRHFEPGLKGWEYKDKAVIMPLKTFQPNEVQFESTDTAKPTRLTYRRTGKNALEAILERQRNGEWTRLIFRYTRAK